MQKALRKTYRTLAKSTIAQPIIRTAEAQKAYGGFIMPKFKKSKNRREKCTMAKSRMEKIEQIRTQMEQLVKQEKELLKKHKEDERKTRTKRLCTRHGMLEKQMPDLITITDEQFESFITRAINTSYGRDTLAKIIGRPLTLPTPAVSKKPMEQKATTSTSAPLNPADSVEATASGSSANPQTTQGQGA